MSNAFSSVLSPTSGAEPALILDSASYAQKVLLQNRAVPWEDATAYSNHLGQVQALLKPAVALIPLDRMLSDEIDTNSDLVEAMGARSRAGFAARTLLSDEGLKAKVKALVGTAVKTQRDPVVLHLPSPLALLRRTDRAVDSASENDFDQDDAENTAVYFADWLRSFSDLNVAGLIFDERDEAAPVETYKPIMNTADHYQWPVGLRQVTEIRFLPADTVVPVLSPSTFDDGHGDERAEGAVLFAEIPEDAVPEHVLARLGQIRSVD